MANEYRVNQADLLAVADEIREKGGTTDPLIFPSEFISAIAGISAMPIGLSNVAIGTYTPTNYIFENVQIEHGLGVIPDFFALFVKRDSVPQYMQGVVSAAVVSKRYTNAGSMWGVVYKAGGGSSTPYALCYDSRSYYNTATETTITVPGDADIYLEQGTTYHWICGVMDAVSN